MSRRLAYWLNAEPRSPFSMPKAWVGAHWWLQGMMGGVKVHYDCIKAFSETDFTEDLKKIDIPVR